jgi:hypothetical protein
MFDCLIILIYYIFIYESVLIGFNLIYYVLNTFFFIYACGFISLVL